MSKNQIIHGGLTYRTNKKKICKEINSELPKQAMFKTAMKFIHKHLITRKCGAILSQMIIPKRKASHIYMKQPQLGQYTSSLDRIIEVYNKLPASIRVMNIGPFKKYLKKNDIKTA